MNDLSLSSAEMLRRPLLDERLVLKDGFLPVCVKLRNSWLLP